MQSSIGGELLAALVAGHGAIADQDFRAIVESLPAAIYTTDSLGTITYYNPAAVRLWGHSPKIGESEFCGSWKLYWPDGRPLPHAECPMALTLKHEKPHHGMEAIAERQDGIRVPFVAYPTPLFDTRGNLTGAVNMLVDISDRKHDEIALQRLGAIVDGSDDAIISKDMNGIITSWNKGAEQLFGYSSEEAIGQPVTMLIPEEHLDEEPKILDRIRRGDRIDHYETVRKRKDGSWVDISLTVSPLKSSGGRVVGASKIARDITERKKQEEQQALLVKEMRHRIKNTLATVQSIASQTLGDVSNDSRKSFAARLETLAGAHDLLTLGNWRRAMLEGLVNTALRPFTETYGDRISISGNSPISLSPERAQTVSLVLHELATNAVKYGALSNETGIVTVKWTPSSTQASKVTLSWVESGGPVVMGTPERTGFGSKLILRALGSTEKVELDYHPTGVSFSVELAEV